ncbi:penicillin-binding protein 1C [Propionivibrio sp.]|uniref:penicillin-binding protein 1C n=1 Tax=Propionivibrio sp. TaxID=2212460 RepID=UPI0025DBBA1E|nr:penicillin-binding protein 1C [Propionivibrio sp.]MBK7355500.1 penicillin-binding protein 1C [Propionivibrio sp.]
MILKANRTAWFLPLCLATFCLPTSAAPSFSEVRSAYVESDALLLARDGRPLQSKRIDMTQRRLPWTRIEDVSPALLRALLASEDRKFYEHAGVDWSAVAASAWRNLWNTRTRGASTLSMQLVGLLDQLDDNGDHRHGRRNLPQKLSQAAGALWLEQRWKKDDILEAYLNLAGFRGDLVGVAAMSRGLFGKWPDGLDERESALAAALLRAPGASPQTVALRACGVLHTMAQMKQGAVADCDGLEGLARLALSGGLRDHSAGAGWLGAEQSPGLAPHLAQKLLTRPGERLRSMLDADLQQFAIAALQRQLRGIAKQNAEDGAVLVLDNATGEVLAWVGSSGALSDAPEVDGVTALRQAGSTLKPFLYALAFERRFLTAASLLDDSPLALTTSNGLYVPQNYEPQYRGWVSARMALGGSLNVPAVRTLVRIGPEDFRDRLYAFGFQSLTENGDHYGFSLALGSADVSLLMLANGYRTLANGGMWSPLRVTQGKSLQPCIDGGCSGVFAKASDLPEGSKPAARRVATAASVFIVTDILADRAARVGTFGLESWLATPYWSAVKTGTSKDMRDNWCIGFSSRYTVAVWVGNAAGEAMHDVSGISGAAPVWREVMDYLHRGGSHPTSVAKPPPAGVAPQSIRFEPAGKIDEAPRHEWFIAGTGMNVVRLAESKALAHIAYPGQGTIIALDADMPPERQRIALQLSGSPDPGWQWRIDGQPAGKASSDVLWRPSPGRHELGLLDGQGRELETVRFEVRALKGKRAK